MGVSKFQTRAGERSLQNYGFNVSHSSLLYGVTFPPERRSAMASGLGPLALAVTLVHETQYKEKLKETLKKAINHVPGHENIINFLSSGKPAGEVFKNLADVLLIMSHKAKRRALFPLLLFVQEPCLLEIPLLTFTGLNPFKFYIEHLSNYKFRIRTQDAGHASEVIFHSIFGTHFENLALLDLITDKKFSTRSQISSSLKRKTSLAEQDVDVINFNHISKFVSANPTRFGSVAAPMLINGIAFAGFRKRHYSQAFKSYLQRGSSGVAVGEDAYSIGFALMKLKESLFKEIELKPEEVQGTVKWLQVKRSPSGAVYSEIDAAVPEGVKLFYS